MRMEIDLVPRYPHMQTMAVTFLGAFLCLFWIRHAIGPALTLCFFLSIHILRTDTPAIDFDITPLGVNLMEVPYIASVLQKMVRIQLLLIDCMRLDSS